MSAFLLLAATSELRILDEQRKKHRRRDRKEGTNSSGHHKSKDPSYARNRRRSDASSNTSTSTSTSRKVFDINTSSYVDRKTVQSPLEEKKREWVTKLDNLKKECRFHKENEAMSSYEVNGSKLFTKRNLRILRYTYLEEFTADYDLIDYRMKSKRKSIKFMMKLSAINRKHKQGLPTFDEGQNIGPQGFHDNDSEVESDNEEEFSNQFGINEEELVELARNVRIGDAQSMTSLDNSLDKSLEGLYQEYATFQKSYGGKKSTIKKIFKSNQFWNNVYQDLKFESRQNSSVDLFELMPSADQIASFFDEFISYFLLNLQLLTIVGEGDDYNFFYFHDFNHGYFKILNDIHNLMYVQQSTWSNTFHNNDFRNQVPLIMHQGNNRAKIRRQLIAELIDAIMENLRISTNAIDNRISEKQHEKLFDLWRKFLDYLFLAFINQDELPLLIQESTQNTSGGVKKPHDTEGCRSENVSRKSLQSLNGEVSLMSMSGEGKRSDSVVTMGSNELLTPKSNYKLSVSSLGAPSFPLQKVHTYIPSPKKSSKIRLLFTKH